MRLVKNPVVLVTLLYLFGVLLTYIIRTPYPGSISVDIRDYYQILFGILMLILGALGLIISVKTKSIFKPKHKIIRRMVWFFMLLLFVPAYQPACCMTNVSLHFFGSTFIYSSPAFSMLQTGGNWEVDFMLDTTIYFVLLGLSMYFTTELLSKYIKK